MSRNPYEPPQTAHSLRAYAQIGGFRGRLPIWFVGVAGAFVAVMFTLVAIPVDFLKLPGKELATDDLGPAHLICWFFILGDNAHSDEHAVRVGLAPGILFNSTFGFVFGAILSVVDVAGCALLRKLRNRY